MKGSAPFNALIYGASGGIGGAICDALAADARCGRLVRLSRSADGVDITDEQSLAAAAQHIGAEAGSFDLIINAVGAFEVNGARPERQFREIDAETMLRAFEVNAVGGAMFLKHFLPLLTKERRAVFATLSARVGSIEDNKLGGWMSYRASKAALNQVVRCAAIEEKRRNSESIVIALHPGTIETPLTRKYARGKYTASREAAAQNLPAVCAACKPEESGGFFDYAGRKIDW